MTIHTPMSAPDPDEVERSLAALEAHLAASAPATEDQVEDRVEDRGDDRVEETREQVPGGPSGETRRVRKLRGEVAEARRLAALQADDTPLLVDTPKVRKRRKKVAEAARLAALDQHPDVLAWRDQRVRKLVTGMTLSAAGIALAASSIGVQASVARALELEHGTVGWWAAFGVEPALSLPLLAAVAVQAYAAMRGRMVDRRSPEGRKLMRTEAVLLGLTLVLNCWPALTGTFDPLGLVVHALGPIAAVTAIWVLPTLWAILAALPVGAADSTAPSTTSTTDPAPTPSPGRGGQGSPTASDLQWRRGEDPAVVEAAPAGVEGPPRGRTVDQHRAELHRLIRAGELPATPSASAIRRALRCREETARLLRDELLQRTDREEH